MTAEEKLVVQRMFLHTKAGSLLLRDLAEQGHLTDLLVTEKRAIERDVIRRILNRFGVAMKFVAADAVVGDGVPGQNGYDQQLGIPEEERIKSNV